MDVIAESLVEYAISDFTLPSETVSGDNYAIITTSKGVLAAVIDGLGHGPEAAAAAAVAVDTLNRVAPGSSSLEAVMAQCHHALADTRGAAVSIAEFEHGTHILTTLCVGEVQGCLFAFNTQDPRMAQQQILLCPGLVGKALPVLQTLSFRVQRGDVLILTTDGITADYAESRPANEPIEAIARNCMARYCKQTDDALVLAIRYLE